MILLLWMRGKFLRGSAFMWGTAAGTALTVAFLLTLASFLGVAQTSMTSRAIAGVSVDWQIQGEPGTGDDEVAKFIAEFGDTATVQAVQYVDIAGFEAQTGGTTQQTGPGQIFVVDQSYFKDFPMELRPLSGASEGVLIAQQTAANLHVGPNGIVSIKRAGLPTASVSVKGVIDLPDADALFQAVGQAAGAGPQAPPDNVMIFPATEWQHVVAQQGGDITRGRHQWHVRLKHDALPADPVAAFTYDAAAAKNLEARLAGKALLADNLGARLESVREDALYSTVLFLFLGAPGIALALALSLAISAAGSSRRRKEQVLLRTRGASPSRIILLYMVEAVSMGVCGAAAGILFTAILAYAIPGLEVPSQHPREMIAVVGIAMMLAVASYLLPVWRDMRATTITVSRMTVPRVGPPSWRKLYLDFTLIAIAALLFWQSESSGYQVVLAPEGVAATAVDYKAFIAPAFAWIGAALLCMRVCSGVVERNGFLVRALTTIVAGRVAPIVAAALSGRSKALAIGMTAAAGAIAFATSTAVFNATYNAQARIDAELTNGSDVTVFGTAQRPAGKYLPQLTVLPGATSAEPMQHRFAYVGTDLQDLYGIDTRRIGLATHFSDAFFEGGNADEMLRKLQATPNGVLVSEETVQDFQLQEGDDINLRLMSFSDHQYHPVEFKFIGVVREFPTAPKDSFLVANTDYISASTGSSQQEYVLMQSDGDSSGLAERVRSALVSDPSLKVSDVRQAAQIIGSSLTAVDLRSLTMIELGFSVAIAAGAAGLMFALGIFERRRSFAILRAIGAKPRQLSAFLWSEGLIILLVGSSVGLLWGFAAAWLLVKLLTGIFDPPPETLSIPWQYLALLIGSVCACMLAVIWLARSTLQTEVYHRGDL